ncbi:MAG: hypothetical protein IKF64_08360 [Eubacterium sp.]|nr:hypothetical protein [Eubacterium sp.]
MKKPVLIGIIVAVVIVVAGVAGYVITQSDKETTTQPTSASETESSSVSDTTAAVTEATTAESTTAASTQASTDASTTAAKSQIDSVALKKGYYYYYNDDETSCIVLKFKKNNSVDIAYLEQINIIDEDPQYFKGTFKYTVEGSNVVIKNLPSDIGKSELVLTQNKGKLYRNGKDALETHDDLKVSYASKHFGA